MICDFPKWWAFLKYDIFKSHFNLTEGLKISAEERIGVGKEEAGTSAFNQAYDKFQAKQEKARNKAAPGFGMTGGSWTDKPVAAHNGHIYSHPKHSF